MNTLIDKYALHLDNLRMKYKLSVEELCEGICSTRQYSRYLNGSSNVSHNKIVLFCDRLGISVSSFFYSFVDEDKEETINVNELYRMLPINDYKSFMDFANKIKKDKFYNTQNLNMYNYCITRIKILNNKIHPSQALDEFSKIIKYPECLKRNIFNVIDIITLSAIAEIEVKQNKTQALDKLISFLTEGNFEFVNYDIKYVIPTIYANVCIQIGRLKRFEDSLKIATAGITHSLKVNDSSVLAYLRYVKSYSLLELGRRQEAEIEAIRCMSVIIGLDAPKSLSTFHSILIKDFKEDPLKWIEKYENELLKYIK